jgi:hypothetical protein
MYIYVCVCTDSDTGTDMGTDLNKDMDMNTELNTDTGEEGTVIKFFLIN